MPDDLLLKSTWEDVWRADDIETQHRDALASDASSNTRMFRPHVDRVLGRFERPLVLEAGCGLGQWLYYTAETTSGGAVGLDLAADTLDRVGRSSTLRPHVASGRVRLIAGDMRNIPLADDSIDVVFSFGVIEHVVSADSGRTVCEFARVLKPGGLLLLATPNVWSAHTLTRPLLQFAGRWRVGFERSISPQRLGRYCRKAGLSIQECRVMESGTLFGAGLTSRVPMLEALSRDIERRQRRLGFMAYVLAGKPR